MSEHTEAMADISSARKGIVESKRSKELLTITVDEDKLRRLLAIREGYNFVSVNISERSGYLLDFNFEAVIDSVNGKPTTIYKK
jgi:hypothetical protein